MNLSINHKISVLLIALMSISMLFSNFVTSASQIVLFLLWLIDKDLKHKFLNIFKRRELFIFISIYFLFVVSLIYTDDYDYAFKDLIIKLPLLILPVVITALEITERELKFILTFFVLSVFAKTLVSYYILFFYYIEDVRNLSYKVSHIRFSLMINFAYLCSVYYLIYKKAILNKPEKFFAVVMLLWFTVFLFVLQSITGIVIFIIINFIILLYFIFAIKQKVIKLSVLFSIFFFSVVISIYILKVIINYYNTQVPDFSKLEAVTPRGNQYLHDTLNPVVEGGNYIWFYICETELKSEWEKRSLIKYDSLDRKSYPIKYTLIRYLNSKGLRKDKDGVDALSIQDIENIEDGIANYRELDKFDLAYRVDVFIWQIDNYIKTSDPSGHSITQRFEYWKIGLQIISNNFLLGVGVGDVKKEFIEAYQKSGSKLDKQYQKRAHNQYLTFFITLGLLGFVLIIFSLSYPLIRNKKYRDFLANIFFIIILLSMLNEDTLETQLGVSFFVLFYSLLILQNRKN